MLKADDVLEALKSAFSNAEPGSIDGPDLMFSPDRPSRGLRFANGFRMGMLMTAAVECNATD